MIWELNKIGLTKHKPWHLVSALKHWHYLQSSLSLLVKFLMIQTTLVSQNVSSSAYIFYWFSSYLHIQAFTICFLVLSKSSWMYCCLFWWFYLICIYIVCIKHCIKLFLHYWKHRVIWGNRFEFSLLWKGEDIANQYAKAFLTM